MKDKSIIKQALIEAITRRHREAHEIECELKKIEDEEDAAKRWMAKRFERSAQESSL